MKKAVLLTLVALCCTYSVTALAAISCKDLPQSISEFKGEKKVSVVDRKNWKSIDVIAGLPYACESFITQVEIQTESGEKAIAIYTNEDQCDGGNSLGVVYTADLKKPLAHISDGDLLCNKRDWDVNSLAKNHQCDEAAEAYALEKARAAGVDFTVTASSVAVNKGYLFSPITVEGERSSGSTRSKEISISVLTDLKTCKITSASISHMGL